MRGSLSWPAFCRPFSPGADTIRRGNPSRRRLGRRRCRESRRSPRPAVSAHSARTFTFASASFVTTSCRNAAFFLVDSRRTTLASGRAIARMTPGTPPPLPTSARRKGSCGRKGRTVSAVAHVLHLGGGAIGDAGEVHVLIGFEEQVDVGREFGVLIFGKCERGLGGELVPEFIHFRTPSCSRAG